jgi:hypothetical protein
MAIAADTYKSEFCSEATAQGITSCSNPPLPLTAFAASPVQIGMTKTIAEAFKRLNREKARVMHAFGARFLIIA